MKIIVDDILQTKPNTEPSANDTQCRRTVSSRKKYTLVSFAVNDDGHLVKGWYCRSRCLMTVSVVLSCLCAGIAVDNPNAVVIGLAPSQFHYNHLNEAFRSAVVYHSLCVYIMYIQVAKKQTVF